MSLLVVIRTLYCVYRFLLLEAEFVHLPIPGFTEPR